MKKFMLMCQIFFLILSIQAFDFGADYNDIPIISVEDLEGQEYEYIETIKVSEDAEYDVIVSNGKVYIIEKYKK